MAGTNPSKSDSDSDGILDGVELANGTDPNKADSDADGFSDGVEFAGGTDALDKDEYPVGEGVTDLDFKQTQAEILMAMVYATQLR